MVEETGRQHQIVSGQSDLDVPATGQAGSPRDPVEHARHRIAETDIRLSVRLRHSGKRYARSC